MTTVTTQGTEPEIQEERRRMAEMARRLETNPLSPEADEQRRRLRSWIDQAPDLTVPVTPELLGGLEGATANRAQEIFTQMILSSAAFAIERPEKAADDAAVCTAGLEGALRSYEAIVAQEPACRRPELDELLQRARQGTLSECVTGTVKRAVREPKGWWRFFSFQGRIGRKSFWLRVLAVNIGFLPLLLLEVILAESNSEAAGVAAGLFALVMMLGALAFIIAMEIQRWHDLGYSGLMFLINLIPLIGGVISVIWLGFFKGNKGPNKYGNDPLAP